MTITRQQHIDFCRAAGVHGRADELELMTDDEHRDMIERAEEKHAMEFERHVRRPLTTNRTARR